MLEELKAAGVERPLVVQRSCVAGVRPEEWDWVQSGSKGRKLVEGRGRKQKLGRQGCPGWGRP